MGFNFEENNMSDKYAALRAAKPYELRFSRLWERYDEACHGNAEHMRDILELTLDALETAERHIANSDRVVQTLLAERDADKRRIAELSLDLDRQTQKLNEMRDSEHEISRRYVILRHILGTDSLAYGEDRFEATEAAAKRLKQEGKSVRLPTLNPQMFNDDVMFGYRKAQREAVEFCAAAGISLKIEGE